MSIYTNTPTHKSRGFTLIELVVVLGIVTVISTVTLTSYSKFGSQVLLRNLVYDIALTTRQAQVHGLSGRVFRGDTTAHGHGIYIDLSVPNQFMLYKDSGLVPDGFYTNSGEIVDTYALGRGYVIDKLCFYKGTSENCVQQGKTDILFTRPEPDALIRGDIGGGWEPIPYDGVRLVVLAPQGYQLSVFIEAAGQISVQKFTK